MFSSLDCFPPQLHIRDLYCSATFDQKIMKTKAIMLWSSVCRAVSCAMWLFSAPLWLRVQQQRCLVWCETLQLPRLPRLGWPPCLHIGMQVIKLCCNTQHMKTLNFNTGFNSILHCSLTWSRTRYLLWSVL